MSQGLTRECARRMMEPSLSKGRTVRKPILIGVGGLLVVLGVIFGLQGLGAIGGSAMTGVTFWAVAGPVIAVVGVVVIVIAIGRGSGPTR